MAPEPLTDVQILALALSVNPNADVVLESFVCQEHIHRFFGALDGRPAYSLDTVTAKLSFERGVEDYSEIRQNDQARSSMASLTGAWSQGEFGTLLRQTQKLLHSEHVHFEDFADLHGQEVALYRFDIAAEDSPWDFVLAGQHYQLAFRTYVWIDVSTGDILNIERTSLNMPPKTGIAEIQWSIQLNHLFVDGVRWLLPSNGVYSVTYSESHHREWNQISFSNFRKYGAEAAIRFR